MRVLVVDDDVAMRKMLRFILEQVGGHLVTEAEGTGAAERAIGHDQFDAITLDVMMPDGDGVQLCRQIRRVSNVPILMLSARGNTPDRVEGLKNGADDYLGKPFDPSELLARIDAVARRAAHTLVRDEDNRLRIGEMVLDLAEHSVAIRGRPVVLLTKTEFRLLLELARARGEPCTRDELELAVWGTRLGARPNTIDSYISDLRRKIEPDPAHPRYVCTVRGKGYRLAP